MKSRNPPGRQTRRPRRSRPRFRVPPPRRAAPPLADALSERTYGTAQIPNAWRAQPVLFYGDWAP